MQIATSVNRVPIRLTEERWEHIIEHHDYLQNYRDEVLDTVENPQWILQGQRGALIAVPNLQRLRYLSVIYKEISPNDGFIISAPHRPEKSTGGKSYGPTVKCC